MWQLLLISAAGLLWDVLPDGMDGQWILYSACIAGHSCSNDSGRRCAAGGKRIFVYLVQIGAFGCIPGIYSSRGSPDPVSVFTLYRNQHSVAGGIVVFVENRSFRD